MRETIKDQSIELVKALIEIVFAFLTCDQHMSLPGIQSVVLQLLY